MPGIVLSTGREWQTKPDEDPALLSLLVNKGGASKQYVMFRLMVNAEKKNKRSKDTRRQ